MGERINWTRSDFERPVLEVATGIFDLDHYLSSVNVKGSNLANSIYSREQDVEGPETFNEGLFMKSTEN